MGQREDTGAGPADASCRVISRAVRSALVRIDATGTATRWPLDRPSCFVVSGHTGGTARVADGRAVFEVASQHTEVPASFVSNSLGCMGSVRATRGGFGVVTPEGAWRFTDVGRAPVVVPGLRPGETVLAIADDVADVTVPGARPRRVRLSDGTPELERVLIVDAADPEGEHVVVPLEDPRVPADVIAVHRNGRAELWFREETKGHRKAFQMNLGGRSLPVEDTVQLSHDRVLVFGARQVKELRADGVDRVRVALLDGVDASHAPLGEWTRENATFAWDRHVDAVVVDERLRGPDCTVQDRITVVDAEGTARTIALPPAARGRLDANHGRIWFVEHELRYEPFNDESGTSLP